MPQRGAGIQPNHSLGSAENHSTVLMIPQHRVWWILHPGVEYHINSSVEKIYHSMDSVEYHCTVCEYRPAQVFCWVPQHRFCQILKHGFYWIPLHGLCWIPQHGFYWVPQHGFCWIPQDRFCINTTTQVLEHHSTGSVHYSKKDSATAPGGRVEHNRTGVDFTAQVLMKYHNTGSIEYHSTRSIEYHSTSSIEYHSMGSIEYHSKRSIEYHSTDSVG